MTFRFVAVGASLGGLNALEVILRGLPEDFPLPVGVVQHRSSEDSEGLAPLLTEYASAPVIEVGDKQPILSGHVYVAPASYHLLVDDDNFALSTEGPVLYARPSIDVFFESAAETFKEDLIGVLLTGMSRDGTAGLQSIRKNGGWTIVQDPSKAEGPLMPSAAIFAGAADRVLPLDEIAPFLTAACMSQGMKV